MAALVVVEPDLGTAMVICFTLGALLVVGGVSMRHLMMLFGGAGGPCADRRPARSPTGARG